MLDKCFRLTCLVRSPKLINKYTCFLNSKLASPKYTKQTVGLFSINTSNIAALSAYFLASTATSYRQALLA